MEPLCGIPVSSWDGRVLVLYGHGRANFFFRLQYFLAHCSAKWHRYLMSIRIDMRSRGLVVLLFIPFVSSIHKERQMCGSELACCVGTKCNCTNCADTCNLFSLQVYGHCYCLLQGHVQNAHSACRCGYKNIIRSISLRVRTLTRGIHLQEAIAISCIHLQEAIAISCE